MDRTVETAAGKRKSPDLTSERVSVWRRSWEPQLLVWLLAVAALAIAALSIAKEFDAMITSLAAPPVLIETKPRILVNPICSQEERTTEVGGHHELERWRSLEQIQQLESSLRDLELRNQRLRRFLDEKHAKTHAVRTVLPKLGVPRVVSARSGSRSPKQPIRSSTPKVQLIGSDALVTATLRNSSAQHLSARVDIELLLNGRVIKSRSLNVAVPAKGTAPFAETFQTSLADGTYSAAIFVQQ